MPAFTKDDRGHRIAALRPADIRRAADSDDPSRARLAVHLTHAIKAESRRFSAFRVLWFVSAFSAWLALQILVGAAGLSRVPGVRFGAFFGGIVILGLAGREITRRRIAGKVAATAVAEGICGQCCYSLNGVPEDRDGRLTCPECGAAWLRDRITRPHWLGESLPPTFHDQRLPWTRRVRRYLYRFITSTPAPDSLIAPDDRGRFVRTVDSRLLLIPARRRWELGDPRVRRLRSAARRKGAVLRFLFCMPLVGLAVVFFVLAHAAIRSHGEQTAGIIASVIAMFFLLVAVLANLSHSFLPPSHTARVLVADGLCGSCIASIAEPPPDADGLRACPKCGASWRTAPQVQP